MRLPKVVRKLLDEAGVEWEIVRTRKHWFLVVQGRKIQTLRPDRRCTTNRGVKNMIANIRRHLRDDY